MILTPFLESARSVLAKPTLFSLFSSRTLFIHHSPFSCTFPCPSHSQPRVLIPLSTAFNYSLASNLLHTNKSSLLYYRYYSDRGVSVCNTAFNLDGQTG